MHLPPPPDSRELLPPLLACLPTAFVSPQPPPALIPLLSPILRQRVQYMSSNTRTSDGWIPLLQWDAERAARLPELIERIELEPHPVSGEIELDDIRPAKYRRLDVETLHSRLEVEQFELLPIFVWCENDEHGQTGAGWKLAELRALEDVDESQWFDSVPEANDAQDTAANTHSVPVPQNNNSSSNGNGFSAISIPADDEEEDDGSYWAAYDRTPGPTPSQKRSPAPPTASSAAASNRQRTQSELEYFSRYGDVQPAMDGHDPDEEMEDMGESSLTGNALGAQSIQPRQPSTHLDVDNKPQDSAVATALTQSLHGEDLSMPRPISPTSSHSSIDRLEEQAAAMSTASRDDDHRAQSGIKQHISTDIKSLFRLARSAGMERVEFEGFVRRELDVLSLLERDE